MLELYFNIYILSSLFGNRLVNNSCIIFIGNQTNLTIEQRTTTNIGVQCNMSLADFSDGKVLYPNCSASRTNILPIEEEDNIDDTEVEVEYGSDDTYVPSDVQSDDEDDMEMAWYVPL